MIVQNGCKEQVNQCVQTARMLAHSQRPQCCLLLLLPLSLPGVLGMLRNFSKDTERGNSSSCTQNPHVFSPVPHHTGLCATVGVGGVCLQLTTEMGWGRFSLEGTQPSVTYNSESRVPGSRPRPCPSCKDSLLSFPLRSPCMRFP